MPRATAEATAGGASPALCPEPAQLRGSWSLDAAPNVVPAGWIAIQGWSPSIPGPWPRLAHEIHGQSYLRPVWLSCRDAEGQQKQQRRVNNRALDEARLIGLPPAASSREECHHRTH